MALTKITESVIQRFSKWFNVNNTTGTVTSVVPDLMPSNTTLYPSFQCRAWVNFNGTTSANLTGSFSQVSSTTVTITVNGHGLVAGHSIWIVFSATLTSGIYTVASVIDSNTFTITTTTGTSSGTVTLNRRLIRASGNVSNVSYNGTGDYTINFTTAMPDANYTTNITTNGIETSFWGLGVIRSTNSTYSPINSSVRIMIHNIGATVIDVLQCNVVVFR